MELSRPIFIIGAARSGTTMLAEILARHPDVAYWVEPKYIWRYRNPGAPSDVRSAGEATPAVARYIRRRFTRFLERHGKARFMEKTPSNCFRVPFIDRVFADGLYLNIVRDGRDVAFSALRKWTAPVPRRVVVRRATSFDVPLRDAPFYFGDALRDVLGRAFLPRKGFIWGPVFPGMREVRRRHGVLETCALQWQASVRAERLGLAGIDSTRRLTVRFEEFVARPEETLRSILAFAGLSPAPEVLAYAATFVDRGATARWRRRHPREVEAVERLVGDALEELGYPLAAASPDPAPATPTGAATSGDAGVYT